MKSRNKRVLCFGTCVQAVALPRTEGETLCELHYYYMLTAFINPDCERSITLWSKNLILLSFDWFNGTGDWDTRSDRYFKRDGLFYRYGVLNYNTVVIEPMTMTGILRRSIHLQLWRTRSFNTASICVGNALTSLAFRIPMATGCSWRGLFHSFQKHF